MTEHDQETIEELIERIVYYAVYSTATHQEDFDYADAQLEQYKAALLSRFSQLEQERDALKTANEKIRAELSKTDNYVKEHALVQEILTLQDDKARMEAAWLLNLTR
jgi:hypothetical protein